MPKKIGRIASIASIAIVSAMMLKKAVKVFMSSGGSVTGLAYYALGKVGRLIPG